MADIFCGIILIRKIFLNFDFFYRENEVFLSFVHVLANAKGQSLLTKPQTCMKWKKIGIELKTVDILEKYLVTGCPIET